MKTVKAHVVNCQSTSDSSFIEDDVSTELLMPSWVPTCQKMTTSAAATITAYVDQKIPKLEAKINDGSCLAQKNKRIQGWQDAVDSFKSCLPVMLQKAPEDKKNEADEASELIDSEAPKPIVCSEFTTPVLQQKISKLESRITRISALPLECVENLAILKTVKAHVVNCKSTSGSFIQDGVSTELLMPSWVPTCQKMTASAAATITAYVDQKIPQLETKINDGSCLAQKNKRIQGW